jgi:hypothetical protein
MPEDAGFPSCGDGAVGLKNAGFFYSVRATLRWSDRTERFLKRVCAQFRV